MGPSVYFSCKLGSFLLESAYRLKTLNFKLIQHIISIIYYKNHCFSLRSAWMILTFMFFGGAGTYYCSNNFPPNEMLDDVEILLCSAFPASPVFRDIASIFLEPRSTFHWL